MGACKVERNAEMVRLRAAGNTWLAIGQRFGVTRERVRQIVNGHHSKVRKRRRTIANQALTAIITAAWQEARDQRNQMAQMRRRGLLSQEDYDAVVSAAARRYGQRHAAAERMLHGRL